MLVETNREGRTRLVISRLDHSIRLWDIATDRVTYIMHTLDYVETIISFRRGDLAVSLNDGQALLRLPLGVQGIVIPPGPIARPDRDLAPGLLARALHHLSRTT